MPTNKRQRKKAGHVARQAARLAARKRAQNRRRVLATVVILGLVLAFIAIIAVAGSKSGKSTASSTSTSTTSTTALITPVSPGASITGDTPCPNPDGSSPRTTKFAKAPPTCIDPNKTYTAVLKTSKGDITIALDAKKAPLTVNNFVVLARYHFYDGIQFHRLVTDFMDQFGDPTGSGGGGPGYQFADELPAPGDYKAGSVAMANSGPNTNGSQFFLVVSDNGAKQLVAAVGGQAKYSLFGQITSGLDVAVQINKAGSAGSTGTPTERITVNSITIQES